MAVNGVRLRRISIAADGIKKGSIMKNDILQKLSAVISALNTISVSGKTNMENLCGSISVLEDIAKEIYGAEFAEQPEATDNTK